MKLSPKGFKRSLLALMILAVPMVVSAQPISMWPVYRGTASWYSETDPGINYRTANNEVFDDSKLTCASWHFPFGTYLKVENEANGESVICRINDRGPAKRLNRLIDLTKGAFSHIAPLRKGLIRVSVTISHRSQVTKTKKISHKT